MDELRQAGVTAFRFVDDLFLGVGRVIEQMTAAFAAERVGEWAVWDAIGRINVLDRMDDVALERLAANGLREVALGIESASPRMLKAMDKRITPEMAVNVVRRLAERGIGVRGYFILGLLDETPEEIAATESLIYSLWEMTDRLPGGFTASVFEYRPYPGTPDWHRLMADGRFTAAQLLDYRPVDLTGDGADPLMIKRDEFNFSTNLPLARAPIPLIRETLARLSREQHRRNLDLASL
jgi:anaerobic magnesium-protoporphyrin IX monomethyl ester cyclase